MRISIEVKAETIASMLCSFVESGDPVTRGWCEGVGLKDETLRSHYGAFDEPWYCNKALYESSDCVLRIEERDDASEGVLIHDVTLADMQRGLEVMAKGYPHLFANVLREDTDGPTTDIFMQCVLFGEEKYA